MTNEEKRQLAILRELEELARIAEGFAQIAQAAREQADELALWSRRMDKLRHESQVERAIEDLDELAAYRRFVRAQRNLDL